MITTKKISYVCDCGANYGSCGVINSLILKTNHSCDVHSFYHTDSHGDTPITTLGFPNHFGINCLNALEYLFDYKIIDVKLTPEEHEVIFNQGTKK